VSEIKKYRWTTYKEKEPNTHPFNNNKVLAYDDIGQTRVCRFDGVRKRFVVEHYKSYGPCFYVFEDFLDRLKNNEFGIELNYKDMDKRREVDSFINRQLEECIMQYVPYFANVVAWVNVPTLPKLNDDISNYDEFLIENAVFTTFDIIDAITPPLREAVKHLLIQQEGSKFLMQGGEAK
jgi:hypothetical protein